MNIVKENIAFSKEDWDSFEASWDFEYHPLVKKCFGRIHRNDSVTINKCFRAWADECEARFNQLKANEEKLNRIFIEIYGLQDELSPEVDDKNVTVRRADLQRDIRSLLSYAVGCMFGRYSLDVEGLAYAGGEWRSDLPASPAFWSGRAGSPCPCSPRPWCGAYWYKYAE